MIIHLRPNIKSAWQTMPSAGTGTKDDPLYWNETGQAQEGYFYIDLPSTGGEYESSVDAWVYGKFEQGQGYDFRAVAMEWGLEVKVYNADNTLVATGAFDENECVFALEFEPEATGVYYFNITCSYVMGEPKIGVNPAPVAITPYIERTKGKAETLGFNEQGRAILYNSIKAANLGLKTVVYAAGNDIPTGDGYETSYTFKPLEFLGKLAIKKFSVYGKRYAYVLEDSSLWTWGEKYNGHGSDGEEIFMPRQIEGEWQDVSVGYVHSIATDKDGNVWGWGSDYNYSLMGKGNLSKPTLLLNVNAKKIEAGHYNNTILTQDNDLYVWGNNDGYGLGFETDFEGMGLNKPIQSPTKHAGKFRDVASSSPCIYAINTEGALFAAGRNNEQGRLGLGDTEEYIGEFTQVGTDTDWVKVSVGQDYCLALKSNGAVYGAGNGLSLGFPNSSIGKVFTQLPFSFGLVKDIYATYSSTVLITNDGKVYGTNRYSIIFPTGSFEEVPSIEKPLKAVGNKYFSSVFILGRP